MEEEEALSLDEIFAHMIKMRAVHRAVGYDVSADTRRIAELRARIKARDESPGTGTDRI